MTDASVVIVGAGQAGLAVAYYLRRFDLTPGREFVLVDRGPGAGGAWQHRWDALRLGSAHHVNDLPGMSEVGLSFETADRSLPAKDIVSGYYRRYEEHFGLEVQRPVSVDSVFDRVADRVVRHSAGEITTRIVVNETGTWGAPFIPWYPGMNDFAGRQLHTSTYLSSEEFAGQSVVVGGGTSAIGFLLELEGVAASLTWATRRPVDFRDEPELTIEGGVAAVAQQDAAARAGQALPGIVSGTGVARTRRIAAGIERGLLVERPMFSRVEAGGVRWEDATFTEAQAIIWATGFRPELRHLAPLKLR
ncbi:flavine-dependent monooxygenase [Leifsonia xyli subsp. xyli str. CTCB07]|uniref:Flavine-dependent monooxygenase n=1 Tax=Leifsonia xyli subsp. xyli (strain CTCB07) TaxID=281090 RepID=Q6ACF2_LEIXX|nr:NAD(P)-binding domain-containing protein [Leifsonia xyli]AAT89941.1 flavine-dependent monooxygenase [Leifsonia xyli subsp. xyli str. CTCB07]